MGTKHPRVNLPDLLQIAIEATALGSNMVASTAPGELTAKGDRDYTSEVDYAVEEKIRAFLAAETPEIGFVGEEDGATGGGETTDYWWALDPIDGTVNFTHGLPLCAVSLALYAEDRPVAGAIELPFLDRRYTAAEGHGAFSGHQPLQVSNADSLAEAVITIGDYAVGQGAEEKNKRRLRLNHELAHTALRLRMLGSAAIDLAWLAEGRTHASITLSNSSWDIGAGVIIAREAGAVVFDIDGTEHTTESSTTIASAPGLKDHLLRLVASVYAEC